MSTTSPPTRRPLSFATEDGVQAEVARQRRHGYEKTRNWSLPQIDWLLMIPIEAYLNPPSSPDVQPTPEQAKMKAGFVDYICANNKLPPQATTAPPSWTPPADASDADIERLVMGMNKLKNYPHAMVEMSVIGPVTIGECRRVHLVHAAHHLSFLQPKTKRRDVLRFNSPDQVIADVRNLKKGHKQAGDWTLPQACWHLNVAMGNTMRPGPHEQTVAMTEDLHRRLQGILKSGQLPQGVQAPPVANPPADAQESAIESFIATLERWKSYRGEFAPHRIFGKISDDEMRQLAMIHCAHHLSFFVPTGE
jgi:hypothetical protein